MAKALHEVEGLLNKLNLNEKKEDDVKIQVEETLALIKPDAVKAGYAKDIIERIKKEGFDVIEQQEIMLSKTRAQNFYAEHKGRGFFDELTTFMSSNKIYALILRKQNAIKDWRTLMGPTKVDVAKKDFPNSIRGLFGQSTTENAVHGSDSYLSAQREIEFFFPSQYTLALIKPTAVKKGYANDIKKIIVEREGFQIIEEKKLNLSLKEAQLFYKEHEQRKFYQELTEFMSSGPIYAFKLKRFHAISKWRKVMGATNPDQAKKEDPKCIRALYATNMTENAVHGSDSISSSYRELEFFFPKQQTLALIKPDGVKGNHVENIIRLIHQHGFIIREQKSLTLTVQLAETFYEEHKGKKFFQELMNYITSGEIYAMKLERTDAIKLWRELMGPTKIEVAKKDAPNSIRGLYGTSTTENCVHGSDSLESAKRELGIFFPNEQTLAIIKPDAVKNKYDENIIGMLLHANFTIIKEKIIQLDKKDAENFYLEFKDKGFYKELTEFMSGGNVRILLLEKYNAIKDWRALMGPTKREVALIDDPYSIRSLYGTDTTQNAVHGSDAPQTAKREIEFFFGK